MNMKKISSLLLALVLVLAMAVPAMAAENGKITIDNAVAGQDYYIYQILDLESYSVDEEGKPTGAYSYKATTAWNSFINGSDIKGVYVDVNDEAYVTWKTGADVAKFAELAKAYAKTQNIAATASKTATGTTVEFTDLDLGYYLLDSTLGTLCSLDTTNPEVTIKEKNEVPSVTKTVEEDSTGDFGATNDADISQTVNFKATVTVQKGAENYSLHDKMSTGLDFDANSVKVTVNGADVPATTTVTVDDEDVTKTNWTLVTTCADGCTFEVKFDNAYIASLADDTVITVTYSATLNDNANIGVVGNTNEITLKYGDENDLTTTPKEETITYTWDMDVLKYANGDETKVLKDAKFVLLNSAKTKVATVVNGELTGWVDVPAADTDGTITWPENTVLTTGVDGKIAIDGLDADTYYLREVAAPAGYNKLADDVIVKVNGATEKTTGEGDSATTTLEYETTVAKVNNQSGTELPSTGGMGTTILYVAGGILVLGAVIVLITKKRMAASK